MPLRINLWVFKQNFSRNKFSVVVCSFIDKISSKHDPDLETASKLNLHTMLLTFCEDIGEF